MSSTPTSAILTKSTLIPCHDTKINSHSNGSHIKNIEDTENSIKLICLHYAQSINTFLNDDPSTSLLKNVQAKTRIALGVIHTALERFSIEEISLSYNGGKDCLVLLILLLGAFAGAGECDKKTTSPISTASIVPPKSRKSSFPRRLSSVYVTALHPFPEIDAFVTASVSKYGLDLAQYTPPMKNAFTQYLDDHKMIKAILVGTRRTDPHGKFLTHFDDTDSGWPSFIRVHPVIDWNYSDIWAFIRQLKIPYCTLYDQGYTSLGGVNDTHPNPALKINSNPDTYKPAYELLDEKAERLGRQDSL